MDIIIKQLINDKEKQLSALIRKAIGTEFKAKADLAIKLTKNSGALYSRIERTMSVNSNNQDAKRVKAGGLNTDRVQLSAQTTSRNIQASLQQAVSSGTRNLPARIPNTANAVAVASNKPQAINLQALLKSKILTSDPLKGWKIVSSAAENLGLVASTAAFFATGGLSMAVNIASLTAGTVGKTISVLDPHAPDFALEAINNYISCLTAWNAKACALIELVDPKGQWSFSDFN